MRFHFIDLSQFLLIALSLVLLADSRCQASETERPDSRLVIGHATSFAPYSFLDENGLGVGYNVDLSREIVRVMQLDAEVRMGPWGELREAMENGEIDVLAMFYSVERDKLLDFSSRFSIVHNAIFMRRDTSAIQTEDDLRGKDIIVIRGDIMHDYVIDNGISDNPVLVSTEAEALRLLASGEHDLALIAKLPGLYWAKKLQLSNIRTVGPLLRPSETAYAVAEGNIVLQQQLSEGLAVLRETGVLKEINDKWLGVLVPKGVSLSTVWKYITLIGIPILLLLTGFIIWSRMLQRQVALRTHALSAEITDRKRVEEALNNERDNLKSIFQAMEDGIYIVDEQYDIQYVNPVLTKDFGIYEGRKCYEYFHDRTEVCPWCKKPDVFAGNTVHREWYSTKNQRTCDLIDTPLKNPDGGFFKLEIFRDITEHKRTEANLQEQLSELRRWHQTMLGREGRSLELKAEVNALLAELGRSPCYPSAEDDGASHD